MKRENSTPHPPVGKRGKPPKSARPKLLREMPQFTENSLRTLLRERVLGPNIRMPDDAAISNLVEYLNFHQRNYVFLIESVERNALLKRAESTLDETVAAFKELRSKVDLFYGANPNPTLEAAKVKRIAEIDAFLAVAATITRSRYWNAYWELDSSQPDSNKKWRELIPALVTDFQAAMDTTNPNSCFALSESGPLSRYLTQVIRMITGEDISAATLKRHGRTSLATTKKGQSQKRELP